MNYQKFRQNVDFYLKPQKEKLESPKEKSFVSPIRIKTQQSNQESENKTKPIPIPISNMMDRINKVILDQRVKSPITTQRNVVQINKENHFECFLKRQGCLTNYYKHK